MLEMEKIIIEAKRAPEPQKIIVEVLKEFSTFFENSSKLSPLIELMAILSTYNQEQAQFARGRIDTCNSRKMKN